MSTSPLRVHQPEAAEAQSLSDRAYYAIRELIVTLELAPGSIVSERELQDRLGVGRTPVREALQRLENERLVEVYPRRGIFVSNVNVLDLGGALGGASGARGLRGAARGGAGDRRRIERRSRR